MDKKIKKIIILIIFLTFFWMQLLLYIEKKSSFALLENEPKNSNNEILWSYNAGDIIEPSPSLGDIDGDGKLEIVIGSYDQKLYALNGEDGSLYWYYLSSSNIYSSSALADIDNDGKLEIVFGNYYGVYAINGEDGNILWHSSITHSNYPAPAINDINGDGKLDIVIGGSDGSRSRIYALNGENGVLLWDFILGTGLLKSSPALGDIDRDGKLEIIVGSNDNKRIYALNGENGSLLWDHQTNGNIQSSPSLGDIDGDGKLEVIVGCNDQKIYVLNGENGDVLWVFMGSSSFQSSPALGDIDNDGKLEVIIGNMDHKIYALNGENGKLLWSYTTNGYIQSSPSLGDINGDEKLDIIIGSYDHNVYALDGSTGNLLWNYTTGNEIRSSPVLGDVDNDGDLEVIVASMDQNIYCLNPSPSGNRIYWQGLSGDSNFTRTSNQAFFDYDFDLLLDSNEKIYGTNSSDPDSDNDGLKDGEEIYNFYTDPNNNDTDGDGLDDNLEIFTYDTDPNNNDTDIDDLDDNSEIFIYDTDPNNPDTDNDTMSDGWEINNSLDPKNNADNVSDVDGDNLINAYEFIYGTNPHNPDSDGDSFNDGIEINMSTNPLNKWWYPMPNLMIIDFKAKSSIAGQPFVLNFTIKNNGIWKAEDIRIIIVVESLNITLYDNYNNLIDLDVDESLTILKEVSGIASSGEYLLNIIIDPYDTINETYSNKDGSLRTDCETDNSFNTILKITPSISTNNEILNWLIFGIILSIGGVTGISSYVIIKSKMKRNIVLKRKIDLAKEEIHDFKIDMYEFIKDQLKIIYDQEWWEKGIPVEVKSRLELKIKNKEIDKIDFSIKVIENVNFLDFSEIITNENNWKIQFSKIFPNKELVVENFENLQMFEKNLNKNAVNENDLNAYPFYINDIKFFFSKRLNIFISYSTNDSTRFQINKIANDLKKYPEIDNVFIWEAESRENIVEYMEKALKISKVFILFCSENSIKSRAVQDEWEAAFQLRKKGMMKIIPVYEDEKFIPTLLTPCLNVKYSQENYDEFIQKLYEEILR
ncbi:MAG: FG-GAP-like repeat-containing protein [Promethearchaeia archaeon]